MNLIRSRKVLIALIFAVLMTGLFWITSNADPVFADVTVTVQAEDPNGGFIVEPKQLTVSAGYANSFTSGAYSNASPATNANVTVLDVLFAAHADKYGTAFTSSTYASYIGGSASYITEMFDIEAGSGYDFPAIMFAVNGVQPRDENDPNHQFEGWGAHGPAIGYWTYAMNQSIVTDGQTVNFFFVNTYNDLYTFIEQEYEEDDEIYTDSYLDFNPLTKKFNINETIILRGYDFFTYGYLEMSGWNIVNLSGARIYKVSNNTLVGTAQPNGTIDLSTLTNIPNGDTALTVKPASGNTTDHYVPIYFIVHK